MRPQSLTVLGLGAIGGSVAWQARLAGIPTVIGFSPERRDAVAALKAGAVDDLAPSMEAAVGSADFVILAAPPQGVMELLPAVGKSIRPEAVVTDVTSIKLPVMERAIAAGLETRFAGSHPYAGTHRSGWEGASPDRFRGVTVYVTSTGPAGDGVAREVMHFWENVLGAHPVLVDARAHDTQLAWTSHLPQAVATVLAATLASHPGLRGASFGSGARDTTRLAASPAEMWTDILLLNGEPVREALERAGSELARLRQLIERNDKPALQAYLEEAARFRRTLEVENTGRSGGGPMPAS